MKVVFLSPPFYSHFQPLLALAKAFRQAGTEVVIACTNTFKKAILDSGFDFWEIAINKNANAGITNKTEQDEAESRRLEAFIDATRQGAAAALLFQAQHRKADMLANPEKLQEDIAQLNAQLHPDLFVVDQLSYGVTLALYAMNYPFITFCPGHPTYIPSGNQRFGVPYAWPSDLQPDEAALSALSAAADQVEGDFTRRFNETLQDENRSAAPVDNAFRLTSPLAILFNYPDFGHLHRDVDSVKKHFMGFCFAPRPLDQAWKSNLVKHSEQFKILVSLGTFLSGRSDVLERIIYSLRSKIPDAGLYIAAGASYPYLRRYQSENVFLSEFLPQTGLLPYMDLVIHHGGNNSFTETLYFGKPAILLPFSSDQFSIAHDAEKFELGKVLDPNQFSEEALQSAVHEVSQPHMRMRLQHWSNRLHSKGPQRAVADLVKSLS
jgi:MGT family glycosyltransferase